MQVCSSTNAPSRSSETKILLHNLFELSKIITAFCGLKTVDILANIYDNLLFLACTAALIQSTLNIKDIEFKFKQDKNTYNIIDHCTAYVQIIKHEGRTHIC